MPPLSFITKRVDRGVGQVVEEGLDAAPLGGADAALEDDLDRARAQVGDQVGQLVGRGAQVDVAAQRFVEQRRKGDGVAVDGACGAGLGVELRPACRLADVVLGEEELVGHVDLDALQVGVLGAARDEARR